MKELVAEAKSKPGAMNYGSYGNGSQPHLLFEMLRKETGTNYDAVRLIAEGCGLSRAEVERLITEGKLVSAIRLTGKVSVDFTFTLKRPVP